MNIPSTPDAMKGLREESKFCAQRYYPGAPTEEIRAECERLVNDFLDDTIALLRRGADREKLFARARALTQAFRCSDTEEREKADDYMGETMRIVGLKDWKGHV
jgi:hypothetical protein